MNSRARLTSDVVLAPAGNEHYRGRMRPRINLAAVMTMAVLVAAAVGLRASQVASREDPIPAGKAPLYSREAGRGQPIIVLHGGPDFDTRYLLPDMDRLADRFRLIYYDQRGRGQSADGVRPEDVTLASDLDDLDKVREHSGEHDFIPPEIAARIARAIPGARFEMIRNCGHFAYLERPSEVHRALDEFFRRP